MSELKEISGLYSRDHCITRREYNKTTGQKTPLDWNKTIYVPSKKTQMPQEVYDCMDTALKWKDTQCIHPGFFRNLATAAGPYTSDGNKDIWKSHFLQLGDCDSMSIAAVQACYILSDDWIPCIAMGKAWLASGKHTESGSNRKITQHAYPVFINVHTGEVCMLESTYPGEMNDFGPGTGHLVSCEWLILPGGCLYINKSHDGWQNSSESLSENASIGKHTTIESDLLSENAFIGKHSTIESGSSGENAPIGSENKVLVESIQECVTKAYDDIRKKWAEFEYNIHDYGKLVCRGSENGMPIVREVNITIHYSSSDDSSDGSSSDDSSNESSSDDTFSDDTFVSDKHSFSNKNSSSNNAVVSNDALTSNKHSFSNKNSSLDEYSSDDDYHSKPIQQQPPPYPFESSGNKYFVKKNSGKSNPFEPQTNMFREQTFGVFENMMKSVEDSAKKYITKGIF